jgi:Acyltransferase family
VFLTSSAIIFAIAAATVFATLNDYLDSPLLSFLTSPQNKTIDENTTEFQPEKLKDGFLNKLLNCFSVKRNISSLYNLNGNENEIKCLHGLKALSILLLFISFKLIPMGRVPYSNRNKLTEFFNSPFSVFLRSSFLYEDVFLVISGVLSSISILKDVSEGGKASWFKKILSRFLRLVLPLTIVLLFYAFIWEHLGTGPQWSAVVDKNADLCKESMWKNLLFIQNFFPIEDMVSLKRF